MEPLRSNFSPPETTDQLALGAGPIGTNASMAPRADFAAGTILLFGLCALVAFAGLISNSELLYAFGIVPFVWIFAKRHQDLIYEGGLGSFLKAVILFIAAWVLFGHGFLPLLGSGAINAVASAVLIIGPFAYFSRRSNRSKHRTRPGRRASVEHQDFPALEEVA